ncbi:hypothetical protein GGX14DRAFT_406726 [Mycena pura]|uniref:Uncharacterized protein n=1 Tax=Mycena pura TaxID=153505 RepID=A0AAD6Y317_9AGAR|nr:hypothetical protein GGX14DRAFT_406726 [Mycena pura]
MPMNTAPTKYEFPPPGPPPYACDLPNLLFGHSIVLAGPILRLSALVPCVYEAISPVPRFDDFLSNPAPDSQPSPSTGLKQDAQFNDSDLYALAVWPVSRNDLVAYCTPSVPRPSAVPSSRPPYILTLDPFRTASGNHAGVFHGQWVIDGQPPSDVVLKSYPVKDFKLLIHELDVYTAIGHLALIVPTLHVRIMGRAAA